MKSTCPWTCPFSFLSEMISFQFHLSLDTIFSLGKLLFEVLDLELDVVLKLSLAVSMGTRTR